ncbi:tetratricopeptide repeat protein [Paludisphaera soli]|uniref:tetratricopeptide repeat protein n=1 Tax=Paludisphaera soli TaxID=2712865 RepID=UPI0013EA0E8F|nr:tetratricopeptide repeat protein [Paludisphaera soli]
MRPKEPWRLLRYLEERPDDARALQSLGAWFSRRERLDEAREAYTRALRADPTDVWTHLYIGNLAYRERDWEVALIWFRFAAMLAPDMTVPLWCQADVYEFQDRQDLAEEYFRKAVEVDPDDEQARRLLKMWRLRGLRAEADGHEDRGRPDLAEECYRKALDLDLDDEGARTFLEHWRRSREDRSGPPGEGPR